MICVAPTAAKDPLILEGQKGLLIADECHHYGSPDWSRVLKSHFERRLGLTATYERTDNGVDRHLDPYFRGVCCSLGYKEALRDKVLADFKIAFIGVRFTLQERNQYDEYDRQCRDSRRILLTKYHLPEEPFGDFIAEAHILASAEMGEATFVARKYLANFSDRREIMAGARAKFSRLLDISEAISNSDKTILFAQTKQAARHAVNTLNSVGIRGAVLDASMNLAERKKVFAGFEEGEHELVAAPLLLDEGVDVPSADLAIVLAASRSRKQMIQRMGRVLRKKKDDRLARMAIIFVEGTSEDPACGAHETFIDLITGAAQEVKVFGSVDSSEDLSEYLSPFGEEEDPFGNPNEDERPF